MGANRPETPSDLVKEARARLAAGRPNIEALNPNQSQSAHNKQVFYAFGVWSRAKDIIAAYEKGRLEALEASAPEARRRKLLDARLNKIMSLAGSIQAIIEGRRDDELGVAPPLEASARPEGGVSDEAVFEAWWAGGGCDGFPANSHGNAKVAYLAGRRSVMEVLGRIRKLYADVGADLSTVERATIKPVAPPPEPGGDVREAVEAVRKAIGEARTRQGNADHWGSAEGYDAANAAWDRVWSSLDILALPSISKRLPSEEG